MQRPFTVKVYINSERPQIYLLTKTYKIMALKAVTFETLLADQKERIERSNAKEGTNLIMDWINDFNSEFEKNH